MGELPVKIWSRAVWIVLLGIGVGVPVADPSFLDSFLMIVFFGVLAILFGFFFSLPALLTFSCMMRIVRKWATGKTQAICMTMTAAFLSNSILVACIWSQHIMRLDMVTLLLPVMSTTLAATLSILSYHKQFNSFNVQKTADL